MNDLKFLKKPILKDISKNHSAILSIYFFTPIKVYDFIQYQNRLIQNKIYLTFECKKKLFIYESFVIYNKSLVNPTFLDSKLTIIDIHQLLEWKKQFLMGI